MYTDNDSGSRVISYADALYESIRQEMVNDDHVFVMGLGVDDPKGLYGTTLNLHKEFGPDRNFDTPLSEDGMTGVAVGAALAGLRPIHVHQRMDFLLLCMNQLVNVAAKTHYMFDGQFSIPIVIRGVVGRSWGQGAQHSQALHSLFMHIPGLRVFAPTTPFDAKGMLTAAIRDDNPVVFMEHRMLYNITGVVPEQNYALEIGKARVLREGSDITIVAISHMAVEAVRAAQILADVGINAEIIDPVSLSPIDADAVVRSVAKTKNLLVVDHSWLSCGASAEIIAIAAEGMDTLTGVKLSRMGFLDSPCPTAKHLELEFYPDPVKIALRARELVDGISDWSPSFTEGSEIAAFRGPF